MDTLTSTPLSTLVTADVGSLYTIINHDGALASFEWALTSSDLNREHIRFYIDLIYKILLVEQLFLV